MKRFMTYTFRVHHDHGYFVVTAVSDNIITAKEMVSEMENCPISAITVASYAETV